MKKRDPIKWRRETTLAVHCLKTMLERRGFPPNQHSYCIQEALGLSYSQAHRKMKEEAPWTLDELAIVADHYQERLSDILEPALNYKFEEAVLLVDEYSSPCLVILGDAVALPYQGMIALGVPGNFVVMPGASISGSRVPARAVLELKIGAMLPLGTAKIQCEALIGNPLDPNEVHDAVAFGTPDGFIIAPSSHIDDPAVPRHAVHSFWVTRPKLVAQAEPPESPSTC